MAKDRVETRIGASRPGYRVWGGALAAGASAFLLGVEAIRYGTGTAAALPEIQLTLEYTRSLFTNPDFIRFAGGTCSLVIRNL